MAYQIHNGTIILLVTFPEKPQIIISYSPLIRFDLNYVYVSVSPSSRFFSMIKLDCIAGESWKDGSSISEIKELGSEQIFQPRLVSTQNQNFSRIS